MGLTRSATKINKSNVNKEEVKDKVTSQKSHKDSKRPTPECRHPGSVGLGTVQKMISDGLRARTGRRSDSSTSHRGNDNTNNHMKKRNNDYHCPPDDSDRDDSPPRYFEANQRAENVGASTFENGRWTPNDKRDRFRHGGMHDIERYRTPIHSRQANSDNRAKERQQRHIIEQKDGRCSWCWSILRFIGMMCDFMYRIIRSPPCMIVLGFAFACVLSAIFAMIGLNFAADFFVSVRAFFSDMD
jgi:hypothetical protein